jgi:hypothetical protein
MWHVAMYSEDSVDKNCSFYQLSPTVRAELPADDNFGDESPHDGFMPEWSNALCYLSLHGVCIVDEAIHVCGFWKKEEERQSLHMCRVGFMSCMALYENSRFKNIV